MQENMGLAPMFAEKIFILVYKFWIMRDKKKHQCAEAMIINIGLPRAPLRLKMHSCIKRDSLLELTVG
jgi:hypothetical protein